MCASTGLGRMRAGDAPAPSKWTLGATRASSAPKVAHRANKSPFAPAAAPSVRFSGSLRDSTGLRAREAADRVSQQAGADRQPDFCELGGRLRRDPEDVPARRGFRGFGSWRSRWDAGRLRGLGQGLGAGGGRASGRGRLRSCGRRVSGGRRLGSWGARGLALCCRSLASRGRRLAAGSRSGRRRGCRSLRSAGRAVARRRTSVFRLPGGGGRRPLGRRRRRSLVAAAVRPAMRQRAEDV
jgi:hypothetical protein